MIEEDVYYEKLICLATLILFGTIIVPSVTVLAEDTSSVSDDGITEGETFSSNESAPVFDTFVEKSTEVINISSYEDTGSGEEVKTVIGEEDVVLATKLMIPKIIKLYQSLIQEKILLYKKHFIRRWNVPG